MTLQRRDFISLLGGAASWPIAARGQQAAKPLVGFINGGAPEASAQFAAAFRRGLGDAGYIDGQNVMIEYHWLEGRYDRAADVIADLIRRHVAVIATPGSGPAALAAKAATATIPIVFGVADDPVRLGLVASLNRPGGNATGLNFLLHEAAPKRLGLLHELVPKASTIAVLVNPANAVSAQTTLVQQAAASLGLQTRTLNGSTSVEIHAAFAALAKEPADALFVASDGFLASRRVQFATLAARERIPAAYGSREHVARED